MVIIIIDQIISRKGIENMLKWLIMTCEQIVLNLKTELLEIRLLRFLPIYHKKNL
ncbi:hypothetical protein EIKCOROL_00657 [Eikenella corrodens ATCC 23834]|uniref:Uncharacterized protein n=1 Tax=Eikenella corrodens ATCC 23834 TaxID=546274 RepID=C0DTH9_EIKCO|nr:hypothetical protein EIKCOROL_00657 [Eikenella corrodens ATCC 23834]